jgi:hypothetical protein
MRLLSWVIGSVSVSLLSLVSVSAMSVSAIASTIEMRPRLAGDPTKIRCPDKVMVTQTPQPYREGGYETDGTVKLQAIATQIAITQVDPFSVTWVGTLKPPYQNCKATAGMTVVDSEPFKDHSYLRLRFLNGKVYFILDMTGLGDLNDFTPVILKKDIFQGNPRWRWGGTD